MSRRARTALFLLGALGLGAVYLLAAWGLPPSGQYPGPYGDLVNSAAVSLRHSTDAVTAVNFDFRGLDTLGEEFILFASVLGATLLLRQSEEARLRADERDSSRERQVASTSEAVRLAGLALVGLTVVFGLYLALHGQVSPGGGFQGGVVLATAPLTVYLAGEPDLLQRLAPRWLVEAAEAAGAGAYALLGLAGLLAGGAFLANVLPLGEAGQVTGGGTLVLLNPATGLEVASGLLALLLTYLEEALHGARRH